MANITIKAPPKSKPGFWLRQKKIASIQHRMRHDPSAEAIEDMVKFFATECEIEAPEGVDVEEALWNMSEEEYDAVIAAMRGDGVPPTNGA